MAQESAFLTCSQGTLTLLVPKPQGENHWFGLPSDFNDGEIKTQSSQVPCEISAASEKLTLRP